MRDNLVQGIIQYFQGEQWNDLMKNHLLREEGEEVYHAHLYVDTSIHPESLTKLLDSYFKAIHRPLDRTMDPQANREGIASIHGIHPVGCPHWEMIFRFNPKVVLTEMPKDSPEAEHGQNLLSWDRACINRFVRDIPFQVVGPREEREIEEYFHSKHWKETLANIVDPTAMHVHPNLEISFDPKIFELYMRRELEKIGWTIDKVVPCIFDMQTCVKKKNLPPEDKRNAYAGKINVNLGHPEIMFDFVWMFNPRVTIQPATQAWIFDTPGFDIWRRNQYTDFIEKDAYIKLTEEEITEIEKTFYQNNPYVRKRWG